MTFHATISGVPRIGPFRELKKALETYWSDSATGGLLGATAHRLNCEYATRALHFGLDSIPTSGRSFYDSMLDLSALLGVLPERFSSIPDRTGTCLPRWIDRYFATARGTTTEPASAMTKWFDTNYHYIVPELSADTTFNLHAASWLGDLKAIHATAGNTRPTLIGPLTYLSLARTSDGSDPLDHLEQLFATYATLLDAIGSLGFDTVQLDEPILVTDLDDATLHRVRTLYIGLCESTDLNIWVQTYFGDGDQALATLTGTGVDAIGVDLVYGSDILPSWDGSVRLIAGVVDGRNVWRTDIDAAVEKLEALALHGEVMVSTSCSLLHVPYSLTPERDLKVADWLAFGEEKIREVALIARILNARAAGEKLDDADTQALAAARLALHDRANSVLTFNAEVRQRQAQVTDAFRSRVGVEKRREVQAAELDLPLLPTTTIGSFPQTAEIRTARARLRKGEITEADYEAAMLAEIADVVRRQEALGLDVLVHGEPERNDMVQYFSEQLDGYLATQYGWVQSYGSRCVRPPILYGDVSRPKPMTVPWFRAAQALTDKPVKGMLTGPITMLAWSFVRDDQPLGETADQVALALRAEIADLTDAGAKIIQVDEPAIRELLPLRKVDQPAYLKWAVGSFRLATGGTPARVQIHTHMCYSEFNELIGPISMLDADVTSIEAARNGMQVLAALKDNGYTLGIGPGVWDIHSPRVPAQEEVDGLISDALENVAPELLWVNPDCGLKTRRWPETTASLEILVKAAAKARANLLSRV